LALLRVSKIVVKELFPDMLAAFPVPPFFIGPDKPGDPFQALDGVTGSGQIGFELGDPVLERSQGAWLRRGVGFVHTSTIGFM
jgi:hypothetical protein